MILRDGGCIFVKSIVRPSYDYEEHRNLTLGVDLRIFDTPMWKIGLGLCCDIRPTAGADLLSDRLQIVVIARL